MFTIDLQIPAKALLFGEYGVLYNGNALVFLLPHLFFEIQIAIKNFDTPVLSLATGVSSPATAVSSRGLTAGSKKPHIIIKSDFFESGKQEFILDKEAESHFFSELLFPWAEHLKNCKLEITIKKSFSPDLGFGSSSAIIAGITYALFVFVNGKIPDIENEFLWQKVRDSLKNRQAIGSGYDVGIQLAWIIQNFKKSLDPAVKPRDDKIEFQDEKTHQQPLYSSEMKMQQGASERRVYKREAHTQATSNDAASSFPMSIFWIYQNQKNHAVPKIRTVDFKPNEKMAIYAVNENMIDTDMISKFGCFVKTNIYSDTNKALKKFGELNETEKIFFSAEHAKIAELFLKSLDFFTLQTCMNMSLLIAEKQGIFIPNLISENLKKHDISFKTMGSGYGDCLWVAQSRENLVNLGIVEESEVVFDFSDIVN